VKRYFREEGATRFGFSSTGGKPRRRCRGWRSLWRRAREGELSQARAQALVKKVVEDMANMVIVEVRRVVADRARQLVERHPLRAYDKRLCDVAVAEELRSMNVG
jgi:hypothetical protein